MMSVARRIVDRRVLHLIKMWLDCPVEETDQRGRKTRTTEARDNRRGIPQGSPLLSNLYLNEVDRMLERAREVTRKGKYTYIEYARFADDLVVLIDAYRRHDWLIGAVDKRLREEFGKLQVEINDEKSRIVDLGRGESFGFLGFDFRYVRSLSGVMRPHYMP
jgi:RNA-directed DNA polymerase